MHIVSVVGARPQFVKLAPIADQLSGVSAHSIIHTGQHYDDVMSDVFFRDLAIPVPDFNLGIGSASHGQQTGEMITAIENVLIDVRPDAVLVYGDTNSTLAASIAAVKMQIPVAHLEAGLRSFNRRMPEEHNRVLTDHSADLLLAPTLVAMRHLENEGLKHRSVLVGDVMTDVLYRTRDKIAEVNKTSVDPRKGRYYVCTIHRAENTEELGRLQSIISALSELDKEVILLAHPRLVKFAKQHGIELAQGAITVHPPRSYPDLIGLVTNSAGVVTDSGGLQKEAFLLRVPCTTIRTETEWTETVDLGWNRLVSGDMDMLGSAVTRESPTPTAENPYGDGQAARLVVNALTEAF